MLHLVLLLLTTSMTMKRFFKIYFFFLLQINTRFKSLVKTLLWLTTMKDKLVHQGNPEDFTWLRWVREVTEQMDAKTSKGHHQCCQLNEIWEKLEWFQILQIFRLEKKKLGLENPKGKVGNTVTFKFDTRFFRERILHWDDLWLHYYYSSSVSSITTTLTILLPK